MKKLIQFCEATDAFDNNSRLKALLFAAGSKPNTYVHLRITNNLHDKHRFEFLLRSNDIPFTVSTPKSFEEITAVTNDKARWDMGGIWYGYDLFRNEDAQKTFKKAVALIKKQQLIEADELLGKHYGYPTCCVRRFIDEHNPKTVAAKYSAREYYERLHLNDRTFPYLSHTPCKPDCPVSLTLNKIYEKTIQDHAPTFYRKYNQTRTFRIPIVVDEENDLVPFKNPDAFDYTIVTMEPIEGHYQLISWLSDKKYARGTVLDATVTLMHDYALTTAHEVLEKGTGFRHERHMPTP